MLYGPQPDDSDLEHDAHGIAAGSLHGTAGSASGSGLLSPEKLVEMTSGFTSYTTSTATVGDSDGAGVQEVTTHARAHTHTHTHTHTQRPHEGAL